MIKGWISLLLWPFVNIKWLVVCHEPGVDEAVVDMLRVYAGYGCTCDGDVYTYSLGRMD